VYVFVYMHLSMIFDFDLVDAFDGIARRKYGR